MPDQKPETIKLNIAPDWFQQMTPRAQKQYLKDHPDSKISKQLRSAQRKEHQEKTRELKETELKKLRERNKQERLKDREKVQKEKQKLSEKQKADKLKAKRDAEKQANKERQESLKKRAAAQKKREEQQKKKEKEAKEKRERQREERLEKIKQQRIAEKEKRNSKAWFKEQYKELMDRELQNDPSKRKRKPSKPAKVREATKKVRESKNRLKKIDAMKTYVEQSIRTWGTANGVIKAKNRREVIERRLAALKERRKRLQHNVEKGKLRVAKAEEKLRTLETSAPLNRAEKRRIRNEVEKKIERYRDRANYAGFIAEIQDHLIEYCNAAIKVTPTDSRADLRYRKEKAVQRRERAKAIQTKWDEKADLL